MKLSHYLMLGAAAGLLSACAVKATDGATKAEEVSGGLFGLAKADAFEVDTAGAFKAKQEVIIGGFQVNFLKEKRASNKAGGGLLGGGFGGKSSANMDLVGVKEAQFVAITEAAYADFQKQLSAQGYRVADRSQLISHEDFSDVSSTPSPKREESSFFGADVTQTSVAPKAIGKLYGGGFGFSNYLAASAEFAEEQKTPVLFVTYTIDFANKAGGHGGWASTTSSLEVGQGISVAAGSGVQLIGGQMSTFSSAVGSVKLGQPISSTETFAEVISTTSDAEAGLETAVNVVGMLGGIGTNQSRSFDVKADPAKYQAVTTKTLAEANAALVKKMAELR